MSESPEKDKKPLGARFLVKIGGKQNGSPETWVFEYDQIKKIALAAGMIAASMIALSQRITIFGGLPQRMERVEHTASACNSKINDFSSEIRVLNDGQRRLEALVETRMGRIELLLMERGRNVR